MAVVASSLLFFSCIAVAWGRPNMIFVCYSRMADDDRIGSSLLVRSPHGLPHYVYNNTIYLAVLSSSQVLKEFKALLAYSEEDEAEPPAEAKAEEKKEK